MRKAGRVSSPKHCINGQGGIYLWSLAQEERSKVQSFLATQQVTKPVWATWDLIFKNKSGLRIMYSRVQMLETQVGEGMSPRVPQAVLSVG